MKKSTVEGLIIGEEQTEIAKRLTSLGYKIYYTKSNPKIPSCCRSHADMAAFCLPDNTIILEKTQKNLYSELITDGFQVEYSKGTAQGTYPNDILLNCFYFQDILIGNLPYLDEKILQKFSKKVYVKQGYSACSTLVLSNNAVITDDISIARCLYKFHADVLLLDKGDIFLDGKNYGFIGGCSFVSDKHTVIFFGELKFHRNEKEIRSFFQKYQFDVIELLPGKLRDIGGIVSIKQKSRTT